MDEQSLFLQALERPADERSAWLSEACRGDAKLRQRIETLLHEHGEAASFLETPPSGFEQTIAPPASAGDRAASLDAGLATAFSPNEAVVVGDKHHSVLRAMGHTLDAIPNVALRDSEAEGDDPIARPSSPEVPDQPADSRYQLQGEIARGGMGAILKGRDTYLGRDLAIKVLLDSHKAKPDMIQRFVEEAQIGGQLQHPGIVPVYELGQFGDRRPFFSMKLVKGRTLASLLADREDASEDRGRFLGIFEQICQTMAYAHSRGVIHRDLKPANVMVGAFGEVQVMDWGLAKVLAEGGVADERKAREKQQDRSIIQTRRSTGSDAPGSLGSAGSETQMGSVMGTPAYMPPEQALGEIDNLDARADVFGLGAILAEILTGKPPYVGDDATQIFRMATRGKLDDCFARLDASGADTELIGLAKRCLAVQLSDRPRHAGELAKTVCGYLESVESKLRETERAKADAQIRAEELRRRNKLAITAGAAIVAALLLGISLSIWQAARATKAERLATSEAERATAAEIVAKEEAERATAAEIVAKDEAERAKAAEKQTADALEKVAAERDAKDQARKDAEQVSNFLTNVFQSPDPTRDGREIKVVELLDNAAKELETDLADQPARQAELQGTLSSTYYALGLYQQAIRLVETVRDYRLATFGLEHVNTLDSMAFLATCYDADGRRKEALELRATVLPLMHKLLGPEHAGTAVAMGDLAISYSKASHDDQAIELAEEALAIQRKVLGREAGQTLNTMHNLATYYDDAGRQDEALKLNEEVLTIRRKVLGPEHPDTLKSMHNLAAFYLDRVDRPDEARELFEQLLPLSRKVLGPEHPETLNHMLSLANGYREKNRFDEAFKLVEEVLTIRRKVLGPEHPTTLEAMANLAGLYHYSGRRDEALKLYEELLPLCRKVLGLEHLDTLTVGINLASSYRIAGRRLDETLPLCEELLPLSRKVLGPEHSVTLMAMYNLAIIYKRAGRLDEAIELQEVLLTLQRKVLGPEHPDTLGAMTDLAILYGMAGRIDEALKLREEVLPLSRRVLGPEHLATIGAMTNLAFSYKHVGRLADAITLQEESLAIKRRVLPVNHAFFATALSNMADLYWKSGRREEAMQLMKEYVALHPDDPGAHNALAWQLVTSPDKDGGYPQANQAVAWARRANELAPNSGSILNTLGIALYRAEQWQEAIDALQKSIEHGADAPHNWLFIAMAHWHLDQKDKSKEWYDKSLAWRAANEAAFKQDTELQSFYAEIAELMEANADDSPRADPEESSTTDKEGEGDSGDKPEE